MRRRLALLLACLALTLAYGGCSLLRLPVAPTTPAPTTPTTPTTPVPGTTSTSRPAAAPVGSPASAERAITAFTDVYINWTWRDVAARMAALARASVGQARAELVMAAADTAQDATLRQGQIANAGQVEAVAPLAGHADEYVVVTRESTTASATAAYQGLAPGWHLTLATVARRGPAGRQRWVVSDWQPES